MKEYRIRARSADHRRAIIGALEGMGFKWPSILANKKGEMEYPLIIVVGGGYDLEASRDVALKPTHTSLDSLLEDIERDRRTVEVRFDEYIIQVKPGGIEFRHRDGGRLQVWLAAEFDRIAAAVKQVRGE